MINLFWKNLITFRYPIIINILLFIYYFSIASVTPYAADDFVYKVNPLEHDFSFKVLTDASNFQIWHYFNWGGRIIVLFFVQLFLIPIKLYFNVINALVQVIIINTLFFYAYNRIATTLKDATIIFLINIFLFIGFYKYSGVSIYLTSTIGYSWMHLCVLLYYLPFWNYYVNQKESRNKLSFYFFGIISGCTNEHVFVAQFIFFILLSIINRINHHYKTPQFYYHSLFGVLTGGAILMFAPGNFIRAQTINSKISVTKIIDYLSYDLFWVIDSLKGFWIIVIPLFLLHYFYFNNKFQIKMPNIIILFMGIISSLAMSFSPSYHNGTNLFLFFCIIIFVLSIFDFSIFSNKLFFLYLMINLMVFSYLYENHKFINEYALSIEKTILDEKMKEKDEIIVNNISIKTNRLVHYYGIENSPDLPRNIHISTYYGIKSIKSVNQRN
jgi:hypothetical protein